MTFSTAVWRGLQGFVLLISALLSLFYAYHICLDFGNQVSQDVLTNRQADSNHTPVKRGLTSFPKSIALPFGRQDHIVNFSSPSEHHKLLKRADPPADYTALVRRGGKFLDAIRAALGGSTPGISFPESELDNGWTKTSKFDEEDLDAIERRWKGTFDALFGGYPPSTDIKPVILVQDKEYNTILDDQITASPLDP